MIAAVVVFAIAGFAVIAAGASIVHFLCELPAPTGPFPVGTVPFTLNRPIEPGETSPGQFVVQLWYPALACDDRAPYGAHADGIKGWIYHHLVRTHSARGAAPVPRHSPVIIYAPGWSDKRCENTAIAEELASHGYAVAAFDGVSRDSPVLDRFAVGSDKVSAEAYRASLEVARMRLPYEAQRASSVLDFLTKMDAGDPAGPFTGRFDLRRVGIFGYSFGGNVALETCRRDRRFSAVMNFAGVLFGARESSSEEIPHFFVSNPEDLTADDPWVRYLSESTRADAPDCGDVLGYRGYELVVSGTTHGCFNDAPLYAPFRRLRSGWSNPPRITAALRQYAVAFFDQILLGTPSALLTPGTRGRPAMTLSVGGR